MIILASGPLATSIDWAARQHRQVLRDSATLGNQRAIDELWEVWTECQESGWDGYDALPVERQTLNSTYCLLDSLPYGFPRPSISADPDGQLTLEWRRSPRRVLSVSVDPDGYLHYAGLYGANKSYGTLVFFSTAPDELLNLVREL